MVPDLIDFPARSIQNQRMKSLLSPAQVSALSSARAAARASAQALLSCAMVAVFFISNSLALTCGFQCGSETQTQEEHPASHHASHHPAPTGEPVATVARNSCGIQSKQESLFSPERFVKVNNLFPVANTPADPLRLSLEAQGQFERPWEEASSPRSKSRPIALRI
jgi:hypothetical protein